MRGNCGGEQEPPSSPLRIGSTAKRAVVRRRRKRAVRRRRMEFGVRLVRFAPGAEEREEHGGRCCGRSERSTAADRSSYNRALLYQQGKEYQPRLLYEQVHVGIPRSPYPPTVVNALLAH